MYSDRAKSPQFVRARGLQRESPGGLTMRRTELKRGRERKMMGKGGGECEKAGALLECRLQIKREVWNERIEG